MLNEGLFIALGAVFALCIGSFINVVIYRLPLIILYPEKKLSLALPRSHCTYCNIPLRLRDNIPLISWLVLRGRCAHCAERISVRYPATEGITLLLGGLLVWLLPWNITLLAALLLCWTLLALTLIDIRHQLLPDVLTIPLIWVGLLYHVIVQRPGTLVEAVIGAAAGYMVLWLLAIGYRYLRGIDGLGLGDAKLLSALGAWLGWQALPSLLMIAAGGGILTAVVAYLLFKRPMNQPLPFGPWLAVAGALLFIFSQG